MKAYVIAHVLITNPAWVPDYVARVHDLVHRHGGRYLARSGNVETLEGDPPPTSLIVLIEFPSKESATAFAADPEYAPFATARRAGSQSRLQLIDDTDLAGTIPYLRKG